MILDEPTSVLTPAETEALFAIIRRLRADGHTVIFISHKLDEVMAISDTVTVLRGGRSWRRSPVGHDAGRAGPGHGGAGTSRSGWPTSERVGRALLRVEGLAALNDRGLPALRGVSFVLRRGRSWASPGRRERAERAGRVHLRAPPRRPDGCCSGRATSPGSPLAIIEAGVGFIPADRQRTGLILDFDIGENLILKRHDRAVLPPGSDGFPGRRAPRRRPGRAVRRPRAVGPVAGPHLSGGNQQKVVLAREVSGNPAVLVAMQPTRGSGCRRDGVRAAESPGAARGRAAILVSTELEEVLA